MNVAFCHLHFHFPKGIEMPQQRTYSFHQLFDFMFGELCSLLGEALLEFFQSYGATIVRVHVLEHLLQPLDLFLRQAACYHL